MQIVFLDGGFSANRRRDYYFVVGYLVVVKILVESVGFFIRKIDVRLIRTHHFHKFVFIDRVYKNRKIFHLFFQKNRVILLFVIQSCEIAVSGIYVVILANFKKFSDAFQQFFKIAAVKIGATVT